MTYKAHRYIVQKEIKQGCMERLDDCLKTIRIVRSVLIEVSMHLEIVEGKELYCSKTKDNLVETVETLIELVKDYNNQVIRDILDREIETKIYESANDLFNQTQEYLKEIK